MNKIWNELNLYERGIVIGSLLSGISVFMPWYSDFNALHNGVSYLGITGPLYLIGIIILIISILNLGIAFSGLTLFQRTSFNIKHDKILVFSSGLSLLLNIIAYSIYFNKQFGINILSKSIRGGFILSFIAAMIMIIASSLFREKGNVADENLKDNFDKVMDKNITIEQAIKNNN